MKCSLSSTQCGWRLVIKGSLDRLVAAVCLLVLAPLIFLIWLLILILQDRSVLFRQVRPGRDGKPFVLLKFRTMNERTDARGNLLPDGDRLTRLGRLLRATSLDELPQLWNVLRGDLSLVGPRPLLTKYLELYTPEQMRRHEVLPGITGWAQINGRNALSWPEKLRLDVWYVDHWSVALDLRILWKTLWQVVRREGISQEGHATMPEFTSGSNVAK